MPYEVIELNELEVNLTDQARTTGWTIDGTIATHEVCNAGSIYLTGGTITSGQSYQVTYRILSISSGGLQPFLGTAAGTNRTVAGFYTETITATGVSPEFRFYSDADCQIEVFNIKNTFQSTDLKQQNTIVWSEKNNKWPSFYTQNPDCAFSMFINLYSFKAGRTYIHRQNSVSRNNFFGTQYKSIIKLASNAQPTVTKTFETIEYKCNQLLITTENGITTSLGQISDLIDTDFVQFALDDGVDLVEVYDLEGNYSAGFLRDKNEDINNGSVLKGNYATIELTTVEDTVLRLFIAEINSVQSYS